MSVNDGLNSQLIFRDDGGDTLRFRVREPGSKTRGFTSFIGDRRFRDAPGFRRNFYDETPERINPSENGDDGVSDDEDDDVEEDEVRKRDALIHGVVSGDNSNADSRIDSADNGAGASDSAYGVAAAAAEKVGTAEPSHLSPSGSVGGELISRGSGMGQSCLTGNTTRVKVIIADPDGNAYYNSQHNVQATQGFGSVQKDVAAKDGSWESLKAILSDPVNGALMDDAVILPCGHSFGAGGIEKVKTMKACYTCSQPVSEESIKPNLSLRVVVQAFHQEEDFQYSHSSKRRKERSDQDKRTFGDSTVTDFPRGRGIQFPFLVGDRIIIKGNKRTPPRFVGRRAIVTTQCLNGWYVLKTLDNAECVKLQHRSLAKISDDSFSKAMSVEMAPAWL